MNKWTKWWDSLPPHVQQYMEKQPIYTAKDYDKAIVVAVLIGFLVGLLF